LFDWQRLFFYFISTLNPKYLLYSKTYYIILRCVKTRDGLNEGIERLNKQTRSENKLGSDSSEPYFYIALVLKGTEKQYLSLLKHVNSRNGAKIVYQCKSLTYLRVTRDDQAPLRAGVVDPVKLEVREG